MENLVQNLVSALHSGKAEDYEKILLDTTVIDEVEQKQYITQDGETIADYFIDDVHIILKTFYCGIVIKMWENIALGNIATIVIYTASKKAVMEIDTIPF
mgnify:CR=1 FL=1